jgi:hypothetical protein
MHAHIKAEHPAALAATYDLLAADGWQSVLPVLPISDLKKVDERG